MANFYWTIQLNSIPPPTALEVGLGQDGNGTPLPASQKGTIPDTGQASPLDGAVSTPLLSAMDYLVSWVWDNALGDLRGPVSATFTTLTSVLTAVQAESVTLTATQTSAAIYPVARAETVALTDSQSTGPTTYAVARAESIALTDSSTGAIASTDCDPFFTNVVLLQHFDNSLLATVGGQFNVDGTVTMSQTNARWNYSININGTPVPPGTGGANVVYSATNSATWDLNATDFTIEGWMWMNSTPDRPRTLISIEDSSNQREEYGIFVDGAPSNSYQFRYPTDATNTSSIIGPPIQLNTWVFLSYRRTGNLYEAAVNGVVVAGGSVSNVYRRPSGLKDVLEGNSHRSFVDALDGIIDDVRVTTVARSLTTVPTGPFPDFQCAPVVLGSVAESVALTDSQNAVVVAASVGAVAESVVLNATQNATAIYGVARAESVVLNATQNAAAIYNVTRPETVALTDSQNATVTSPAVLTGTVNEVISLTANQDAYVNVKPLGVLGHLGGDDAWVKRDPMQKILGEIEAKALTEMILIMHMKGVFKVL